MRKPLAVLAAAAAAALGGAILGEYSLSPVVTLVAAALFGVVVGEVEAVVAGRSGGARPGRPATGLMATGLVGPGAAALFTAVAWAWSLWISTGHRLGYAGAAQWAGTGVAAAAAFAWSATAGRTGR